VARLVFEVLNLRAHTVLIPCSPPQQFTGVKETKEWEKYICSVAVHHAYARQFNAVTELPC